MAKKKSDPKVHYPEIPAVFMFPDDLDSPQIFNRVIMANPEADWIKAIRNYCRENSIAPTTLITAYEELKQRDK